MSARSDYPAEPSREEVRSKLLDLIEGRLSREAAASWASAWITADDPSVADETVWDALLKLSGADMISTDRPYLYGKEDFREWLEELRRG